MEPVCDALRKKQGYRTTELVLNTRSTVHDVGTLFKINTTIMTYLHNRDIFLSFINLKPYNPVALWPSKAVLTPAKLC